MTPEKYRLLEVAKLRQKSLEEDYSDSLSTVMAYNDVPWLITELEQAWVNIKVLRTLLETINTTPH